jgi:hypothetical protein
MNYRKLGTIVLFAGVIMSSKCGKDEVPAVAPLQATTVNDLAADTIIGLNPMTMQPLSNGKYTFYSLERNAVVTNSDSATNKWDLGFAGTTIITNSGTSFTGGQGGAFVWQGLFDNLTTIPTDSTFKTDNGLTNLAIPRGSNRAWYIYDAPTNLINIIPGRVIVVRTASGKYAKVEILNYYRGGTTPAATASDNDKLTKQRYFKFRYTFQPNGTKQF